MRLFIAINFNSSLSHLLQEDINQLKKDSVSGNFTPKENLHLTLAFLGEISESRIPAIQDAMREACRSYQPSSITIKGFGKFIMRGEILYWRGVNCSQPVLAMQNCLVQALRKQGFMIEDRPFTPHITMGRRCKMKEEFSECEYEKGLRAAEMTANTISLMKSECINGRMVYTSLFSIPQ